MVYNVRGHMVCSQHGLRAVAKKQDGIRDMADKKQDKDNSENKGNKDSKEKSGAGSSRALRILIKILAVLIVLVIVAFYVIYYRFAHAAKKLAYETANMYAFGSGKDMAEYIAPGYIKQYEDKSKVLSISDIQDIYITKFRTYVNDKIGDIDKIECKITDIKAVSNVEDLKQTFADNGVSGVSQYRSVDADWIVTGKDGDEITLQVQEFVLKCDDGWYVDYVLLPADVDSVSTPGTSDDDSDGTEATGSDDAAGAETGTESDDADEAKTETGSDNTAGAETETVTEDGNIG